VTLFALTFNGQVNAVGPSVNKSYVNDVAIYYSSWNAGFRALSTVCPGGLGGIVLLSSRQNLMLTFHPLLGFIS
jgi:hypothetical protein